MIKLMESPSPSSPLGKSNKRLKLLLLTSGERSELSAQVERLVPLVEPLAALLVRDLSLGEDLSTLDFDLAVVVGGGIQQVL